MFLRCPLLVLQVHEKSVCLPLTWGDQREAATFRTGEKLFLIQTSNVCPLFRTHHKICGGKRVLIETGSGVQDCLDQKLGDGEVTPHPVQAVGDGQKRA